jgi:hypothetical protein
LNWRGHEFTKAAYSAWSVQLPLGSAWRNETPHRTASARPASPPPAPCPTPPPAAARHRPPPPPPKARRPPQPCAGPGGRGRTYSRRRKAACRAPCRRRFTARRAICDRTNRARRPIRRPYLRRASALAGGRSRPRVRLCRRGEAAPPGPRTARRRSHRRRRRSSCPTCQ